MLFYSNSTFDIHNLVYHDKWLVKIVIIKNGENLHLKKFKLKS